MQFKKKLISVVILGIIANILILFKLPVSIPDTISLVLEIEATKEDNYQFFYSDGVFDIVNCQTVIYDKVNEKQTLKFDVPTKYNSWRIDFGNQKADIKVYSIRAEYKGNRIEFKEELLKNNQFKGIFAIENKGEYILLQTTEEDPQCIFGFAENFVSNMVYLLAEKWCGVLNIIICIALDVILIGCLWNGDKVASLFKELWANKKLILNLAKNDFKTRFVGSYLGIIWAFVQPVITILVYWFVFQIGLKSGDVEEFPFILWLMAGLVPWFFFSDALSAGTTSLIEYQYLVKKIVFKISVLPIVKILSALFVHMVFILLTIVIFACYGYVPDWYTLQVIYYTFCIIGFTLGIVYFTCSVAVFFRDTIQIIGVVLQVGMWMTPIMWQVSMLPTNLLWIFKMMPMYYIVTGYRDSLINKIWFWEKIYETAWFWGWTIILFVLGTTIFRKLKIHFADVL